jgi:Tfp pilus assembly protein PilO
LKPLSNLEKFGLAAALIAASTFFYMKYIYDPQVLLLQKTLDRRNKIVRELNQINDTPSVFQLEKTIEQDKITLAELRKQSGGLAVKTGNPDEITRLLARITRLMDSSHLTVQSITPKTPFQGPFLKWSPFEMDLKGYFQGLMMFLDHVRELEDAVEIQDLAVVRSPGQPGMLQIKFILNI